MEFTGNEDHPISLEEASKLTGKYRTSAGTGAILGGYISKSAITKLLDQEGCVGIRYYYGENESAKPELVLVGVKSNIDDIYDGEIMEHAIACPPYCAEDNPLNS